MEKILVVDDDDAIRETLHVFLKRMRYNIITADNGEDALSLINKENPDLVISDIKMPNMSGLDLLTRIKESGKHIPVLLITGYDDVNSIEKALTLGAFDYIEKPLDTLKFKIAVHRAIKHKRLQNNLNIFLKSEEEKYNLKNFNLVTKSTLMKDVFKKIIQASKSKVNIFIQGESGTGKKSISKLIHYNSIWKEYPYIYLNCSEISGDNFEKELFGFKNDQIEISGKLELAGEGTIYLDEISEISSEVQTKLLRILQEREYNKIGDNSSNLVNARIIASTNKNLEALVKTKKFNEDLYFRLKVFSIEVPPLKERKDDITELVLHIIHKLDFELHKNIHNISDDVIEMFKNYEWPGNIDELKIMLALSIIYSHNDSIEKENVLLRNISMSEEEEEQRLEYSLLEVEKEHILKVLNKYNWDKNKAARQLKISLPTLYAKISNYKLK